MDRERYLTELEEYLQALTPEERADAIMFYSEFIEDAGLETRAQIEDRLGTPRALSKKVLADYSIRSVEKEVKHRNTATPRSNVKMIWLVILALLASPVLIGVGGILIGLLVAIVAVFLAVVFGAVILFCGGVVLMGVTLYIGFALLISNWAVGLFYLGIGVTALGALLVTIPIAYWIIRVVLQGIANLSRYLYDRLVKNRNHIGGDRDEKDI